MLSFYTVKLIINYFNSIHLVYTFVIHLFDKVVFLLTENDKIKLLD